MQTWIRQQYRYLNHFNIVEIVGLMIILLLIVAGLMNLDNWLLWIGILLISFTLMLLFVYRLDFTKENQNWIEVTWSVAAAVGFCSLIWVLHQTPWIALFANIGLDLQLIIQCFILIVFGAGLEVMTRRKIYEGFGISFSATGTFVMATLLMNRNQLNIPSIPIILILILVGISLRRIIKSINFITRKATT